MSEETQGHTVASTCAEVFEMVTQGDLNIYGTMFGGKLLSMIDKCAGLSAFRHAGAGVVTVAIDRVEFHRPIRQGAIVTVRSCVNRSFNSSMEVGAVVTMENPWESVLTPVKVCKAYLTFVALDPSGKKLTLPPILPETEEEKRRFAQAEIRRAHRIALSAELSAEEAKKGA